MNRQQRLEKYKAIVNNECLDAFGFVHPFGCERIYPCISCGRDTRLIKNRVLYCLMCSRGYLHPKYNFDSDRLK